MKNFTPPKSPIHYFSVKFRGIDEKTHLRDVLPILLYIFLTVASLAPLMFLLFTNLKNNQVMKIPQLVGVTLFLVVLQIIAFFIRKYKMIYYGLRNLNVNLIPESTHKFMLKNLVSTKRDYKLGIQDTNKSLRLQGMLDKVLIKFENIEEFKYTFNYIPRQGNKCDLKVDIILKEGEPYHIYTWLDASHGQEWQEFLERLPKDTKVEQLNS